MHTLPMPDSLNGAVEAIPEWPAFVRAADAQARAALGVRLDRLQDRLRVKDATLSVLRRTVKPGMSLAEADAVVRAIDQALAYDDDASRLALASYAAGMENDPEHP